MSKKELIHEQMGYMSISVFRRILSLDGDLNDSNYISSYILKKSTTHTLKQA